MAAPLRFQADAADDRQEQHDLRAIARRAGRVAMTYGAALARRQRARVLGADSDIDALVGLLKEAAVLDQVRAQQPLLQARIRGIERRRAMIEEAGGAVSVAQAAEMLGISRQAVEKRLKAGSLLGVRIGARTVVPAFQVDAGESMRGLDRVLKALGVSDPWMRLNFFLTRDRRLKGRTPLVALASGKVDEVVRAAGAYGVHGAA